MSGHEMARVLLDIAAADFKAISNMLDPGMFDDSIFGFHAQQTVEKTLKAWLCVLHETHPYTHDLRFLLRSGKKLNLTWDSSSSMALPTTFDTKRRRRKKPRSTAPASSRISAISWPKSEA